MHLKYPTYHLYLEDKPIVITSYGSSNDKPIISGSGDNISGGDFQEAIYVNNNDNMIFDGLEIQNNRTKKRNDIDDSRLRVLFMVIKRFLVPLGLSIFFK